MGAVGGLLGLGGGGAGTSFAAPGQANIQSGVDTGQAGQAYGQTQQGLGSQQALLAALQGQNGLQLQNQAAQGYSNLANGVGPNPAQAQLAQNTGANVAQTGALMAGQRGASQNVGLLARQAGQQGAATQQQAVGQAATLQAQQQLAGLQGLAGQGNTIAGQQIGQTNANIGAQQAQYANVLNALGQQNQAQIGSQQSVNAGNAQLANTQLSGQQSIIGGLMSGIGLGSAAPKAEGGEIRAADGYPSLGADMSTPTGMTFPQFVNSRVNAPAQQAYPQQQQTPQTGPAALQKGTSDLVQGLMSRFTSAAPAAAAAAARGGEAKKDMRSGGPVKASSTKQKASAHGDNYSNDKIPAVLSEHEIVLPRSVTMSKNPIKASADFVAKTLAKKGRRL